MGHTKTTIELNGKLYDATTGAMVGGGQNHHQPAKAASPKPTVNGATMDGFIRRPNAVKTVAPSKPAPAKIPASPSRTAASQAIGHTPQSSKTLMRHAVSKPTSHTPKITSKANPVNAAAHHQPTAHKQLLNRKKRAAQINQSSSISRFNFSPRTVEKKYAPLAVQPHPEDARAIAATSSKASDSFEAALQNATSHQQPAIKTTKRRHRAAKKIGVSVRTLNIGAISLAVVLLTGFIAYQNIPNVSMRIASSKAGFNASLPGYTPSGFGMSGPIKTNPGAVTISFRSHSDQQRSFEVSQKPSNWTSDSLLSNHVAVGQRSYQTYQEKGKTIYIYDNDTATWVNGGVWYEVSGNSSLNTEQLLRIADSM